MKQYRILLGRHLTYKTVILANSQQDAERRAALLLDKTPIKAYTKANPEVNGTILDVSELKEENNVERTEL